LKRYLVCRMRLCLCERVERESEFVVKRSRSRRELII
jgi:hypothetical protein